MRCPYCAKKINEAKLESKQISLAAEQGNVIDPNAEVDYVCPRCGHLIHANLSEEEMKSLSQAAHAQVQRANNDLAKGLGTLSIGAICLITSFIFYLLAKKPSAQHRLVVDCPEFYVFVILAIAGGILAIVGAVLAILGAYKKKDSQALIHDIHNETFYQ